MKMLFWLFQSVIYHILPPTIFHHLPYSTTYHIPPPTIFHHLLYSTTYHISPLIIFYHLLYFTIYHILPPTIFHHLSYSTALSLRLPSGTVLKSTSPNIQSKRGLLTSETRQTVNNTKTRYENHRSETTRLNDQGRLD